ncbi:MAG: hypothetical protein CMJ34_01310 [Phycisphaerae bacterium]|nr:hypothetical protein [Phycisphaerae bacterium]
MRTSVIAGLLGLAAAVPVSAQVSITEARIGQPGVDSDLYIELAGAPGTDLGGLQIVVIGDLEGQFPPAQNGGVEFVASLNGTIGASGRFILAADTYSFGTPDQIVPLTFEQGDNLTIIVADGYGGSVGDDVDTNDDGILDPKSGIVEIDSVAILANASPDGFSSDFYYSDQTVGPVAGFPPLHVWQCEDTLAWRSGDDALGGADETPGLVNPTCGGGGGDPEGLTLSEFRLDQSGSDNDEYIEISGTPGSSLDGVFFISIGDGSGGSGVAECVIDLTGYSIGASGFFVIAESTFSLGIADLILENELNLENSDNVTYLLVSDFTGERNDDLDADDDGVIDSPLPWSGIIDGLALIETFGSGELVYSDNTLGPDGSFVPAQGYRCTPDGTWTIGLFSPLGETDTPGAANLGCPVLQCGGADPRNCFEARAEPGCSDVSCCDLVSDIDPACATLEWDDSCVTLAQQTCLSQGPAPSLTLSEVRMKQAGEDADEYFELIGAPGTSLDGVSLVVIGSVAEDSDGAVETAVNLSGFSIGSSGYFVVAEETFTLGTADATLDLVFNDTMNKTLLLVHNFTGTVNGDLDADADCTLDSQPWGDLIDGVAWLSGFDSNCVYSTTTAGPDGDYSPGHAYVCDSGSGTWGVGTFVVGDVDNADTPGTTNPEDCDTTDCEEAIARGLDAVAIDLVQAYVPECCTAWDAACDEFVARNLTFDSTAPALVEVVEIRMDQFGDDNDEYIELATAPGQSLDGYTVVVIGDGSTGSGQVETRIPLVDVTADANGLVLIADSSTFTLGTPSFDFSFDIENSDNITCLVVYGFSGEALAPDLDAEDDGVLDSTPWVESTSCVALIETDPSKEGDQVYCDTRVGPDDIFVPAHVYFDCGMDAWEIGLIDPVGKTDTPGVLNAGCEAGGDACEGDFNDDGQINGADFGSLLAAWGVCDGCLEDLNDDGLVSGADVGLLLSVWGPCP